MATTKKPVSSVCSKAGRTLATVCRTKKVAVKAAPKAVVKKTVAKPAPKAVVKKTVSKPAGKIKLDRITIKNAEGNQSMYDKFPKTYPSYAAANKAVIPILNNIVQSGGRGYNKVSYIAYFKDGETYEGRLDVSPREDNPLKSKNVFGDSMKAFVSYYIKPSSGSSEEEKQEYRRFLNNYEL